MIKTIFLVALFLLTSFAAITQNDDLFALLEEEPSGPDFTIATFKSTRIINGQSIQMTPANEMIFTVSHHFGRVNSGLKQFFGLDQSTVRLGLEYGITDWFTVELGRSSFNKMVDGSVKFRLIRQQTGERNIPVTVVAYSSANIRTAPWIVFAEDYLFNHRLAYTHQVLIARKFSSDFSLQLMPTLVHFNMVALEEEYNTIPALGIGGRYKFLPQFALNAEYFFVPDQYRKTNTDRSLSVGFDLETGGHVFQLFLTNSMAMYDPGFIAETNGKWTNGDIFFGFNITRVFTLTRPK